MTTPTRSSLRPTGRHTLKRMAATALTLYFGVVVMLALFQRALIYVPDRVRRIEPAEAGLPAGQAHTVRLQTDDGLELRGWHVLPAGRGTADPDDADRQLASGDWVVLYFSGNAGHRGYRVLECETFASLGCHVLLFDYRGYGDNPGSPTEEHLAADARAVWRFATQTRGVAGSRVLLAGESLGGGVAVRLAAELCEQGTPAGGLILRSTFTSLVDVAAYHYPWLPVRWLMVDRFPSGDRIPAVTCPILQIHGDRDTIIPMRYGQRLFEAAPERSAKGVEKRFVPLRGADHNDVLYVAPAEMRRAVREFLDALPPSPAAGDHQ